MKIVMNSDGGSRGNPGPAGIGVVIYQYRVSGIEYIDGGRLTSLDPSTALRSAQDDKEKAQDDMIRNNESGIMNNEGKLDDSSTAVGMTNDGKYNDKQSDGVIIQEISEYIGETTNNQAEYRALIAGLEWVKSQNMEEKDASPQGRRINVDKIEAIESSSQEPALSVSRMGRRITFDEIEEIECRLDSELVVKQLRREYKMKNEGLKPLFDRVNSLVLEIGKPVKFVHVYREANKEADRLVNLALDKQQLES